MDIVTVVIGSVFGALILYYLRRQNMLIREVAEQLRVNGENAAALTKRLLEGKPEAAADEPKEYTPRQSFMAPRFRERSER